MGARFFVLNDIVNLHDRDVKKQGKLEAYIEIIIDLFGNYSFFM